MYVFKFFFLPSISTHVILTSSIKVFYVDATTPISVTIRASVPSAIPIQLISITQTITLYVFNGDNGNTNSQATSSILYHKA